MPEHTGVGECLEAARLDSPDTIFGPIQPDHPTKVTLAPPDAAPHTNGARRPMTRGGEPNHNQQRSAAAATALNAQPPGGTSLMSATTQDTDAHSVQETEDALTVRRELVADIRAFADHVEQHPDLPIGHIFAIPGITSRTVTKKTPRDVALADLVSHVRSAGPNATLNRAIFDDELELELRFGEHVRWRSTWPRDAVCTPRIDDGKVVYDPPSLDELRASIPGA